MKNDQLLSVGGVDPVVEPARIGLIVACSENGVIGVDGDLPWRLPDDLRHFMRSTRGHAVIMGRKTFESLGKPREGLGGRLNIVVSSSMGLREREEGEEWGVVVVRSVEEGIAVGRAADVGLGKGLVWVAGGGEIYRLAVGMADVVVRTRVHCRVEGDVFFEELDPQEWVVREFEEHKMGDGHSFGFTIEYWVRVKSPRMGHIGRDM